MMQTRASPVVSATLVASTNRISAPKAHRARVAVRASQAVSEEGFEMMRKGVKVAAEETVLTPRYVALGGLLARRENSPHVIGGPFRAPLPSLGLPRRHG